MPAQMERQSKSNRIRKFVNCFRKSFVDRSVSCVAGKIPVLAKYKSTANIDIPSAAAGTCVLLIWPLSSLLQMNEPIPMPIEKKREHKRNDFRFCMEYIFHKRWKLGEERRPNQPEPRDAKDATKHSLILF